MQKSLINQSHNTLFKGYTTKNQALAAAFDDTILYGYPVFGPVSVQFVVLARAAHAL
ncbi:hypothetical protein [Cupriavidus sp. D39]|uniref:hypothetical protein n=1 Tax=Cupriavidus sp. D39 TaxID=2997877 RepID=UPI002271DF0F|nr:hypothetical protein [Cupriavidus sp. D39]MCY0855747.1 hypothetical protein [Cupriavidus sp. D39]